MLGDPFVGVRRLPYASGRAGYAVRLSLTFQQTFRQRSEKRLHPSVFLATGLLSFIKRPFYSLPVEPLPGPVRSTLKSRNRPATVSPAVTGKGRIFSRGQQGNTSTKDRYDDVFPAAQDFLPLSRFSVLVPSEGTEPASAGRCAFRGFPGGHVSFFHVTFPVFHSAGVV